MKHNGLIIVGGDCFSHLSVALLALLISERRKCRIFTVERPNRFTVLRQARYENADVIALSGLRSENLLSVMELAEERLVLTSLKLNAKQLNRDKLISALRDFARTQAPIFTPNPKITVI